jgi:hypothetical protein
MSDVAMALQAIDAGDIDYILVHMTFIWLRGPPIESSLWQPRQVM